MPVADPSSGRLFIWLISCFLFIAIATGGTFLILYIILPQNSTSFWLPIIGVTLVCLPWLFWCFTCFYRIISRALGFRFFIGGGGGSGNDGRSHLNAAPNEPTNLEIALESTIEGGGEDEKHVQFREAVVVGEEKDYDNDYDKKKENGDMRILSSSNSSNDLSITSHESEMPLTSTMAS